MPKMAIKLYLNPNDDLWEKVKEYKSKKNLKTLHETVLILIQKGLEVENGISQ